METTHRTVWCYILGHKNPLKIKFRLGEGDGEVNDVADLKQLIRAQPESDLPHGQLSVWKVCCP